MSDEDTARETNRRFTRVANAAKKLGVGYELLQGLIDGHQIEGFRTKGRSGEDIWFIYDDEIKRLEERLRR
jgi:hypothetical protein